MNGSILRMERGTFYTFKNKGAIIDMLNLGKNSRAPEVK